MRKLNLFFIVAAMLFTVQQSNAQIWDTVGTTGFSAQYAYYNSIAMDTAGVPYVVFASGGTLHSSFGPAVAMKFNGTSWVTVGSPRFSGLAAEHCTIAIDKNTNIPYVAYDAYDTIVNTYGPANVMKFDGTDWVQVGSPNFSAGEAWTISIAIDNSGTPYVVYMDSVNGYKATVMKYNGTSWVSVGSPGFSAGWAENTAIAIDSSGTPYVVFENHLQFHGATVMKFDGTSWVTVGGSYMSDSTADWPSIAIDHSSTPYVSYFDYGHGGAATVKKFDGTSWVGVGSPGFTTGSATFTSIVIDNTGAPYVAFCDQSHGLATSVVKFDGTTWNFIGTAISRANVWYTSMALNKNGIPYVTFADAGIGQKASVMKLHDTTSTTLVKNATVPAPTLTLFPNPNNGTFSIHINAPVKESATVIITNMLGEKVKEFITTTNKVTQQHVDAPPGTYSISARTKDGEVTGKIVIE